MRHLLAAAAATLLLTPAAGNARYILLPGTEPQQLVIPEPGAGVYRYSCDVTRVLKGGTVRLSRIYTDEGKRDAGDFMHWNAAGYDPQRTRRPLEIDLSYIWDEQDQPKIEPREIEMKLRVGADTDLPEVAWIQMQRPFPVKPHGILGSTALSTMIFPYGSYDAQNGHGEMPLGDLLAYAEGYDMIDWKLIRPSDKLGGSGAALASGTIDIAALREAVAALPELRTALAAKTIDPKAHCERSLWPEHILY